ncbi:MAG TPA: pyruvate dehydrogenase (acetyl-transferring) E1 component subunit alpha [Candidatus Cloacimonadota bacterium]|nr:pyruvate dehydrogenase (acetyl-transferring) E1 component subunit alpha [Candidatus Cloacimonadota bacterium]HPT72744.1 pyruvate dehydrogenase (acetyl-transferring) E1 component subunit alpha [Candidatus Cloacimonadota bacterium]
MIESYDPQKNAMIQIMDKTGKIIGSPNMIKINDEDILAAYKTMLFNRTADLMAVGYQRQGRMYTYPPNLGQEAIAAAAGKVMKEEDWLVPAFREMGAWLSKGAELHEIFMYFRGDERGSRYEKANRMLPSAVPIASQLQYAAGIAYAMKFRKEKSVVFAFVGDGGTSEGDFHEAMNFASVWKAPLICIIQNNQFAISMPIKKQTNSVNLASKAIAYGIPGIQVDGNDYLAMLDVITEAREYTEKGKGPLLIEAVTYRQGAHTTSDDPTRYRTDEEEKLWLERDPLLRLRLYLQEKKLISEKAEEELVQTYRKQVDAEFDIAENYSEYPLDDVFNHLYSVVPEELKRQKKAYEQFILATGGTK